MVEQEVMRGQLATDGEVKVVAPSEREGRLAQVKRILSNGLSTGKQICDDPKEEVKPRKRKERHESIGSITQERKVVRSNSEERPLERPLEEDNQSQYMRRVSSHEDFKKSHPLHERNFIIADLKHLNSPTRLSPHRDPKPDFLLNDDLEHEKRRSSERFSRPLAPRGRRSNFGRKRKTKAFLKAPIASPCNIHNNNNNNNNNNDCDSKDFNDAKEPSNVGGEEPVSDLEDPKSDLVTTFLQLHTSGGETPRGEGDRSPSPVSIPAASDLDLTTLHQQIDCSEPIPSSSTWGFTDNTETMPSQSVASVRMLLSPRNSIIMTRRIYMDTDVPMPNKPMSDPKNPLEQRLKQLSKQINSLKKKVKKYEEEFEAKNGYRPSHVDRMEDKSVKKICTELNRLRKELKQLKDDPLSVMFNAGKPNPAQESCGNKSRSAQIQETLVEIEKRLTDKRTANNRLAKLEEMSGEELMDEKVAVQKALLYFESVYGRPSSKEDRDLVRPLYDRYRTLKRMVARSGMGKSSTAIIELATIHEHETMDFVSQPSGGAEPESDLADLEKASTVCGSTDSDTDTSLGENLHALPLEELLEQQRATNEEKKRLRRSLKEYENEFQTRTGRKLQKDDRMPMEGVYLSYKQAKAKLRLLEALVTKHTQ